MIVLLIWNIPCTVCTSTIMGRYLNGHGGVYICKTVITTETFVFVWTTTYLYCKYYRYTTDWTCMILSVNNLILNWPHVTLADFWDILFLGPLVLWLLKIWHYFSFPIAWLWAYLIKLFQLIKFISFWTKFICFCF
jgi:hypothetical protein